MKNWLSESVDALLHLIYPRICMQCGWDLFEDEQCLCLKCQLLLPTAAPTLYHPQLLQLFYGRCDWYHGILYLKMEKTGGVRDLIHALKYHDAPEVGQYLGERWGKYLLKFHPNLPWDIVIPVPMHPLKEKQRGYNQCDAIVEGFTNVTGLQSCRGALIRMHLKESQTNKGRWERNDTHRNPFYVPDLSLLMGKRVLLLDDVVTTGATMEWCYQALKRVPGIQCSIGALAYPIHNRVS
jgi:predicted amidophosphoribosyltransferase